MEQQTPQTAVTTETPRRRGAERAASVHPAGRASRSRRSSGRRATRGSARSPSSRSDVEFPATWSQNATNIVAQKYFRGQLDSPTRERSVKQMISPRRRARSPTGAAQRGYFASVEDGDAFEAELTLHPAAPDGGVQLAGLVQRRLRGEPAVQRLLHPLASRTRWSRSSTGTPRRAGSSAAAPARASTSRTSAGRWSRCRKGGTASGPGLVHARRRLVGRHDQVRRQDAPRGEDGRARRRPPGHPRVHLVQGQGGGQGRRAARRRVRHVDRRRRLPRRSSTRTPTTRSASPTSSCTRSRTTTTGA